MIHQMLTENSVYVPWSGCQIWLGQLVNTGYGVLRISGKPILAHRASWIAHNGPIPDKGCVLHRCDVRPCVNPSHLFIGTRIDNNKDRHDKGRTGAAYGSLNSHAKLSENQVLAIRADPRKGPAIAKEYGLSRSTVYAIKNKTKWRHL
jgi:hypothetical protein